MVGVDLAAQHVAKKKGFRDTICLARLSGWGDSLFFFHGFCVVCACRMEHRISLNFYSRPPNFFFSPQAFCQVKICRPEGLMDME